MNTKNDLIVLPIGKILIIRKKGIKQFLKVNEDNTVIELNEEEREYINNIFHAPKSKIIYFETALDVARKNENLKGHYNVILPIVEEIDEIIPEDSKEIFYKNLKTLKYDITLGENRESSSGNIIGGSYEFETNKITMPQEYIEYLQASEKQKLLDNAEEKYIRAVVHEMLHMASSEYDSKNGIIRTRSRCFWGRWKANIF